VTCFSQRACPNCWRPFLYGPHLRADVATSAAVLIYAGRDDRINQDRRIEAAMRENGRSLRRCLSLVVDHAFTTTPTRYALKAMPGRVRWRG
jgi:hypothetical protein